MAEKENEDLRETTSNEEKMHNSDILNEDQDGVENSEDTTTDEVKLPTLEEQYAELNNKYVRLYSDFDNFRKRTIKEKADIISTASGSLMKEMLGTLDDFERAIENNDKLTDIESVKEGFKLIYHKFSTTLKQKGLEAMECKGEVFDADKHEAITNIPVEDQAQKGKIIDVIERGYNLHGRSLRYAKVVVGQ